MCGFVGIFETRDRRKIDAALLARMNDALTHRGPDDCGYHTAPGIGLGHRRLSIIDLSGGRQPMFNEDGSVAVVYNGEIYNFQELTKELRAAGHRFKTLCDTEVIVHAWEEWGTNCVKRFRGMFAFALWDENQETLFLARDRLGIKPLYYSVLPSGALLFGSELKALLCHPDLPRKIDPCAVEDYLAYGYIPDPKTIYSNVVKLAPAHFVAFKRNASLPSPRAYWDLSFEARNGLTESQACEELIALLSEAVQIRMIADVPLGAFLSGGVDSSSVVAMMAGHSASPVNSFSIGFEQADHDESDYATEVARTYRTRHYSHKVNADSFDLVDGLAKIFDEPFADSSAIPTYRLSAMTREQVTVALSGDGGDEVLAGYRRHLWHHKEEQVRARIPARFRRPIFGLLGSIYPKMDWAPQPLRAKSTLQALARDSIGGYFDSVSIVADDLRRNLYSETMRRDLQGYHAREVLAGHMGDAPADDHLGRVQYADIKTYLPGDILTKVDRVSMANSLEVRVPFLDHHFVEWAARLPAELRLKGREGKYILKKAMEDRLPHDVLYRRKMGFAVPLRSWFRGPLRDRVRASLTCGKLSETGYFDMDFIAKQVDQHQAGTRDHSAMIWALVMFESFLRQVHLGNP